MRAESQPLPARALSRALAPLAAALLLPALAGAQGAGQEAEVGSGAELAAVPPERVLQLTIEDAVRIALEQNLELELEGLRTDVARFNAYGSWGSFDPVLAVTGTARDTETQGSSQLSGGTVIESDQLQLNSSLTYPTTSGGSLSLTWFHTNDRTNNSFSLFDTSTTDVLTVQYTQPLLRGAWSRFATTFQRGQELEHARQVEGEKAVRNLLVLDVSQAYWDLASAIREVEVRLLSLDRARKQLEQDTRRHELGAGTEVDILQSETNQAQAEEELLNARFLLRTAEDVLRRKLFQKPEGAVQEFLDEWDWPIQPLTELPDVRSHDLDWQVSLQRAIERRPEVWQRRYEVDAAEVQLESARSDRKPQLDLELSTSSAGFDPDPDEAFSTARGWDFPDSSAALVFSIPIGNRTASYAERAARAGVRQARLTLIQQELIILAEVRQAVRDLTYAAEGLLAAEKSAALAQRQLEAEQVRLDIGLSTTFQVLEFQETLAEAQSTETRRRADYAKAIVKLAHVEGFRDAEGYGAPPEEQR
jgi:outer membrane protein TolC